MLIGMAEKVLDVDSFLRTYAMEVLTGQSDGIWNANNYFRTSFLSADAPP